MTQQPIIIHYTIQPLFLLPGISSSTSLGRCNQAYLRTPEYELESSFSDEQKLCSTKPYIPSPKARGNEVQPSNNTEDGQELGLPPPPNNMWYVVDISVFLLLYTGFSNLKICVFMDAQVRQGTETLAKEPKYAKFLRVPTYCPG